MFLLCMVYYILIVLSTYNVKVSGICTWPSSFANSEWTDSVQGSLMFTDQTVTGWDLSTKSIDTWQCHSTDWLDTDSFLVLRTVGNFELFSQQYYGFLCLKLSLVTDNSYRYYIYNPEQSNLNNDRVYIHTNDALQDVDLLCSNTTDFLPDRPALSEYRMMIKKDNEASAKINCPYQFLGKYDYIHTDHTGSVTCASSTDTLDTCTDRSVMTFSYDTCSTRVAYSVSTTVWCVDTVPVDGDNYVTVYNGNDNTVDGTSTFRFTCIAVSGDGTTASVSPNSCKKGQSPGALPSGTPAATLQLTKNDSCVSCPGLIAPDSGNVSYSTDGAVTTATYQCSELYSLAGSPTRTCQSDLTWSSESPTCTCIVPSAPANGGIVLSFDGSTITYSCHAGYVLSGTETRTCQSNSNTWSGAPPTCEACDSITQSAGLNISQTVVGTTTVTSFACDTGYTLNGVKNSTCQADGSWNPAVPICTQCQNLTFPASGTLTVSTDGYTSMATFICVSSYNLVGSTPLTCDTAGTWSDATPTCYCDDPPAITNGSITANGTHVSYSCGAGYNMNGSATRTCSDDGTGWSGSAPACESCGSITAGPEEIYNLTTDGVTSEATFSCVAGYTLTGQRTITCQLGTTWTTTHTCVQCIDLTDPSSGSVSVETNGTTSVATYTCASGYSMLGQSTSICHTDGTWLTPAPTCYCSPVSALANGQVISDDGQEVYYACDLGFTLSGSSVRTCSGTGTGWSDQDPVCVSCPSITNITGGSSFPQTDGTVTTVDFTCDVGYTIAGKTTLTCQTNGTWDNSQPSCTLCATLADLEGGNVTLYSESNTTTKATYTCDVGYTLDGASSLLTCGDTGTWDLTPPTCSKCKDRTSPSSSNVTLTTDGETTTANYICAAGYSLSGQSTITCRSDGNWNYPLPSCSCDTPVAPSNGNVTADGSTVTFTCNIGFTMSEDSSGTCQTDGSGWDISTPTCVSCDFVPTISDGNLTLESDGTTTQAVYTCSLGGSLLGSATVSCNTSGTWTADQPQCVTCPSLTTVNSGSVNVTSDGTTTSASYDCDSGYYLSGSAELTCTTNGSWSAAEPQCLCDAPSVPSGGSYNISEDGQTITYTCGSGYTIDGQQNISCGTDGSGWSITAPTCVECISLSELTNGNLTMVTTGAQSQAYYTCDLGYTMNGSAYAVCQTDGTWNASEPECVPCPSLNNITSGSLTLSTNGQTTIGNYTCAAQYYLEGTSVLTCSSGGTWDQSPPSCYCTVADAPANGAVSVSVDKSTLTYTCDTGYILDGTNTRTCQSSGLGWTDFAPTCATCSNLEAPANGNVSLASNGSITMATYHCENGYSMDGDTVISCQSNGTWSGNIPTCVQCPTPTNPSSGAVTMTTDGVMPSANYSCSSGYYLVGLSYLTCNSSGIWNSVEPVCVCEAVLNLANGNITYSNNNNTVNYTCDLGYSIDGVASRTCGTDGTGWNGTDPKCVTCPNVTETSSSNYSVVSDGTMTSVEYKCDQGTSLSGTATLVCTSDGTWNGTEPQCVSCPTLSSPDSGSINVTTDGLTTSATYVCAAGYETVGDSAVIECQTNGSWSFSLPSCNCIAPSTPSNGSITLTDDSSTVTYSCDLLYTLVGNIVRVCQQGGAGWNGTDPSCEKCDSLTAPANGDLISNTTGSQTVATFTCDNGTSINGDPISYCETDGTWSSSVPVCVFCASPATPDSGQVTVATNGTVTTASFSCMTGYSIDGSSVIICNPDGQWASVFPNCVCDHPGTVTNGAAVSDGHTTTYMCTQGFTLNGVSVRTCQGSGGGWTDQAPNCAQCMALSSPNGGNRTLGTNGTVTTASFNCDVGTTLNGTKLLTCGSDGSWDTNAPTCVSCGSLGTPANGDYSLSSDGTETAVTLQCASGYDARGITSFSCQSDGTWSSQGQGYCEKSDTSSTVSYLTELIVVSVLAAVIITALSILLCIFVRLYCKKKEALKYKSDITVGHDPFIKDGKISHFDNENPFSIPNGKIAPSIAPASHERHVLDMREGSFLTSPAPSSHGRHITNNGVSPRSSAPLETERSISSTTSVESSSSPAFIKSIASLSSVDIVPNKPPPRLRPLSGHTKLIGKIGLSQSPNLNLHKRSPQPPRSNTPVNHSLVISDVNDNTISDVCN